MKLKFLSVIALLALGVTAANAQQKSNANKSKIAVEQKIDNKKVVKGNTKTIKKADNKAVKSNELKAVRKENATTTK